MSRIEEMMDRIRAERIARRSFPNIEIIEDNKGSGDYDRLYIKDRKGDECSDIEKLLIELKKDEPTSDNQFFRLCIIGYEFGSLQRALVYAQRFRGDEREKKIHLAHAKLDIADMITQIHMLCLSLGDEFDFEELRKLGVQHLKERHDDFQKNGWSEI